MADLALDGRDTSYDQRYGNTIAAVAESTHRDDADFPDLKLNCKSPVMRLPWDFTWISSETPVSLHDSSSGTSSNSNFLSPFPDELNNRDSFDIDWKLDVNQPGWDKENLPASGYNSKFLFAETKYNDSELKNVSGDEPLITENQQFLN